MSDGLAGLEWGLVFVGAIALGVAIVATGLVAGHIGVAMGVFLARTGRFVRDLVDDLVRSLGSMAVALLLVPVAIARGIVPGGRGMGETLRAAGREALEGLRALRSALVVRPLVFVGLSRLVGHVAARLPAALAGDGSPRAATDFPGYRFLRELPRGGSGARVLVAEPDDATRRRIGLVHGLVVIKSFDFDDGTRLAELLRESRALESARSLGLVLDHETSERRFHYVMRYHEGVDLGKFVRSLHEVAESGGDGAGLDRERLLLVTSLVRDLVATLRDWHLSGLWHKDVKPENAIVHEGRATLIDLSLVTPLASQMTLTTHGTEFYRDPELVRHALRGARVSEVDAARFDVYGAGAVLYFALEGTFPAHGALSSFRKPSPESLRWIVRRAMADFDRRYPDAASMLRDLDAALAGGDPTAVRPADLPSMRGTDGATDHRSDEERFLHPELAPAPRPKAPDATRPARPAVKVVDWWSGRYEVRSLRPLPPVPPGTEERRAGPAIAILFIALAVLAATITLLAL